MYGPVPGLGRRLRALMRGVMTDFTELVKL